MRLNRVRILNFRSIQDLEITFVPSCRVLVGVNESGKTNILDALSLLDDKITVKADDLREFGPDESPEQPAQVRFIFSTSHAEREFVYNQIVDRLVGDASAYIVEGEGKRYSLKEYIHVQTELLFIVDLKTKKKTPSFWYCKNHIIAPTWRKTIKGATFPEGISEKPVVADMLVSPYVSGVPDSSSVPNLTMEGLKGMILNEFLDITGMPEVVQWKYDERHLLPGSLDLATFAADPECCIPLKFMFLLAGYSNISKDIEDSRERKNGLSNLLNRVSAATTKHVIKVWKEFKGLSLDLTLNGSSIDATIKDTFNKFDLSRRSDGFKRFMSFLLLVSAKAKAKQLNNVLYLHDEPDTSLHPSGARYLRDELIRLSETNYVIYSTHSIFMIDSGDLCRHLIVKKKGEVTTAEKATEVNIVDEEVIYNALGYSIFENLKEKNIIFEGKMDKELFKLVASKSNLSKATKKIFENVGLCHAKGVKDIGRITPLLELANRKYIVISDNDEAAREQQKKYDGAGKWMRYDELGPDSSIITAEDFMIWASFSKAVDKVASEKGLSVPVNWDVERGNGKLEKIKIWLRDNRLPETEIRDLIKTIKFESFDALRVGSVSPQYEEMLNNLGKCISQI